MSSDFKIIKIDAGRNEVKVSPLDFEHLSKFNWFSRWDGYAFRWSRNAIGKKIQIKMHREILGEMGMDIDHANRDKRDNRRENLRICTRSQNLANKIKTSKPSSSAFKGVYWIKARNTWCAKIISKPIKLLKTRHFKSEIDAAKQYNIWALETFGEYARLNEVHSVKS